MTLPMIGMSVAVLVGAVIQRSTGMGFALLAAPFLVLFLGPLDGIIVSNACGAVSCALVLGRVHRDLDRPRARTLVTAGAIGCLPGAVVVRLLPLDWLGLTVAAVVLIALLVSIFTPGGHLRDTAGVRTTTGLLSGFMSVTAGVGGPALAVYARGIDWRHRSFAATAQLQFLVTASTSLLVKFHVPDFSALGWVMLAGGMLLGLLIGERVAGRLSGPTAMRLVMVLAMAGTLVALGRAIWNLWGA